MGEQTVIRCACGRVLGVQLDAENFEQRHQGRTTKVIGPCTITITCETCRRTTLVHLEATATVV